MTRAPAEITISSKHHDLRFANNEQNPFIVTPSSTCSNFNHNDSEDEKDSTLSMQVAIRLRPLQPTEPTHCIELVDQSTTLLSHLNEGTNLNTDTPHFLPEADRDDDSVWTQYPSPCQVLVRSNSRNEKQKFTFDHAFPCSVGQESFYTDCVSHLVRSCIHGYNATVFAYGQTGSGKTYTIMGPSLSADLQEHKLKKNNELYKEETDIISREAGVIPRALRDLFDRLEKKKLLSEGQDPALGGQSGSLFEFQVKIRVLEIYGEAVRDLLAPSQKERLAIRDGSIGEDAEVLGAREVKACSAREALALLVYGISKRVTGCTAINSSSSRSHVIFTTTVEQEMKTSINGSSDSDKMLAKVAVKRSKFHFIDLAGSERANKARTRGKKLKEGININKGLLVLGNVISALADPKKRGKTHIPYRESKLTRLLKGSLGGNHKTLMIACVSSSLTNCNESINTLRYANRAKNIQNHAVVNVDPTTKAMAEMRSQVTALAAELLRLRNGNNDGLSNEDNNTEYRFTNEQLQSLSAKSDSSRSIFSQGASTRTPAQNDTISKVSFPDLPSSCQSSIASSTSTLSSAGKLIRSLQELYELLVTDRALSTNDRSYVDDLKETRVKRIVDETRKNCSLNNGHDSKKEIDSFLEDILTTLSKKDQFQLYASKEKTALPMSEITIDRNATLFPSLLDLDHTTQPQLQEEEAQHSVNKIKPEIASNNSHRAMGEEIADDIVQVPYEIAEVGQSLTEVNLRNKLENQEQILNFLNIELDAATQAKCDAERIAALELQLELMALQKEAADQALRAKEVELEAVLATTEFDYENTEKKGRSIRQKKKKCLSGVIQDQPMQPRVNFHLTNYDQLEAFKSSPAKRLSKKDECIGSFFVTFLRSIFRQQQKPPILAWKRA